MADLSLCHFHQWYLKIQTQWVTGKLVVVKNPPANAGEAGDTCLILGREDALEEEMATHSSMLAWRIPWTEEPGRLQSMESQRVGHD